MLTLYRPFLAFAHLPLLDPACRSIRVLKIFRMLEQNQLRSVISVLVVLEDGIHFCIDVISPLWPLTTYTSIFEELITCPAATHDSIIFQLQGHGRCEFCTAGHFPLPKSVLEFSCNTASEWHGGHQFWPHHSVEDWAVKLLGNSYIAYRDQVGNGYQKRSAGGQQLSVSLSWSRVYSS